MPLDDEISALSKSDLRERLNDRDQREERGERKIEESNLLRGGQFVCNEGGLAVTLSFCFQDADGKWFGLTAAHFVREVGEEVFGFTGEQADNGVRRAKVIGNVYEISLETDSMLFEVKQARPHRATHLVPHSPPTPVCCAPHRQDVKCIGSLLAPHAGLGETPVKLPAPSSRPASRSSVASSSTETTVIIPSLAQAQRLVGFGASRRGAYGAVSTLSYPNCDSARIKQGDIGITHIDGASKKLSDGGDCGTVFIDEYGNAVCMHHVLRKHTPAMMGTTYESFGVPMQRIVDAHALLRGAAPLHDAEDRCVGPVRTEMFQGAATQISDTEDIAHFRIEILSGVSGICESHQLLRIPFCI
jgi:hypothetical protein